MHQAAVSEGAAASSSAGARKRRAQMRTVYFASHPASGVYSPIMAVLSGKEPQSDATSAGVKRIGGRNDATAAEDSVDRTLTPETPLPGRIKLAVFIIALCESTQINSLFAFAAFMVEDLIPGLPEENVGYYAGVLAASFQAAQCCTSIAWGRISDRVGRKPALLVGLVGSIVALIVVGFAPSYGIAVLGRVLAGSLNGNITVLKAYVAEITDDTNRSRGFSLLPLSWGTGSVIGPLIGGLLSRPYKFWPSVPFFRDWPYALPCLAMALLQVCAIVLTVCVLEETRPCDVTARFVARCRRLVGASTAAPVRAMARAPHRGSEDEEERVEQEWKSVEMGGLSSEDTPPAASPTSDPESALSSGGPASDEPWADGSPSGKADPAQYGPSRTMSQVLGDRPVLLACLNYGLLAFVYIVFDESLPLFLKAGKERGGLGFHSSNIGITLGVGGIVSALFVYFLAPRLVHGIGALRAYRIGLALSAAVFVVFPFVSLLVGVPALVWASTCTLVALKLCVGCFTFVASMLLVNHSVEPDDLGSANGLGQMLGSLARTVGPATGGAVFALSERATFWMHQGTVSWLLAFTTVATLTFSTRLPDHLRYQRKSSVEVEGEGVEVEGDLKASG